MPFNHLNPPHASIDFLITHYLPGGACQALTIGCADKASLINIYEAFSPMDEKNEIKNFDESTGEHFHRLLHVDMQAALGGVGFAATLTDFHQHWVSDGHGERLTSFHLVKILKALKVKKYIDHDALVSLVTGIQD